MGTVIHCTNHSLNRLKSISEPCNCHVQQGLGIKLKVLDLIKKYHLGFEYYQLDFLTRAERLNSYMLLYLTICHANYRKMIHLKTIIKYQLRESTRFVNKAAKISVLLICKGRFTSSHNKKSILISTSSSMNKHSKRVFLAMESFLHTKKMRCILLHVSIT